MGVAEATNLSYGVRGSGHEHHRERHLRSAAAARPKHQNRIGVERSLFLGNLFENASTDTRRDNPFF